MLPKLQKRYCFINTTILFFTYAPLISLLLVLVSITGGLAPVFQIISFLQIVAVYKDFLHIFGTKNAAL